VSDDFTVRIVAPVVNSAPEIVLMTGYSAMYNETFEITPTEVFDADGDEVTVWYDWGDDTTLSAGDTEADYEGTHVYVVTGNVTLTAYVNDNTGDATHNVSATTTVTISSNRRPTVNVLTVSPASGPYYVGDTLMFNITVSDLEGDVVTIKVDFGDDSAIQSQTESLSEAGANVTVTFTHSYESAETYTVFVWVEDEFDHPDPEWISRDIDVAISDIPETDGGINWLLIGGIGVLVLVVIVVAAMLMKKRKGKAAGDAGENSGGMEGMAPPEDVPPPPGQ
jgi:hypothetical protein